MRARRIIHVHGKPVTITEATIQATRQHFANIDRTCKREALAYMRTGGLEGFRVNNVRSYIAYCRMSARRTMRGTNDWTATFAQMAVVIQTGECVGLLA